MLVAAPESKCGAAEIEIGAAGRDTAMFGALASLAGRTNASGVPWTVVGAGGSPAATRGLLADRSGAEAKWAPMPEIFSPLLAIH